MDITIRELAESVARLPVLPAHSLGLSKPDGTPKKQLDVSRLKVLGWQAKVFGQCLQARWLFQKEQRLELVRLNLSIDIVSIFCLTTQMNRI